ncbi:MAG: hypothetical protein WC959_02805 [Kiritimatiellales bacterium]
MNIRKRAVRLIAGLVLIALGAQSAESISVNFFRQSHPGDRIDTDFKSVAPAATWENVAYVRDEKISVSNIGRTGLSINSTPIAGAINEAPWKRWPNSSGPGVGKDVPSATLTLSKIPYAKYYIVVYLSGWGKSKGSISDGTTTYYYDFEKIQKPSLVLSTDTSSRGGLDGGSYVVFGSAENPLISNSLALTLTRIKDASGVGGFQIVKVD